MDSSYNPHEEVTFQEVPLQSHQDSTRTLQGFHIILINRTWPFKELKKYGYIMNWTCDLIDQLGSIFYTIGPYISGQMDY
jgi:hypothetical protein